jgi:hypothetical protein
MGDDKGEGTGWGMSSLGANCNYIRDHSSGSGALIEGEVDRGVSLPCLAKAVSSIPDKEI